VSRKSGLVSAAAAGRLPAAASEVKPGALLPGYVANITKDAGARLSALLCYITHIRNPPGHCSTFPQGDSAAGCWLCQVYSGVGFSVGGVGPGGYQRQLLSVQQASARE
jgi:hypothetical protein